MLQSKLIELLRRIPPGQLSRYGEFLRSPYFNKNEDNVLFFSYLENALRTGDDSCLMKKQVLETLKTTRLPDEKTLAYLMSQQLGLLEKFLSVERFLSDGFAQQLTLMQAFHELQLPKHYKPAAAHAEKAVAKSPLRNARFFQKDLIFKSLLYEHSDPSLRAYDENLQATADALDAYFLVEKLRYACKMTNLENILNLRYRMPFVEQALAWSASEEFRQAPAVQVYRGLLLLLRNPQDTAGFAPLKNLLVENEGLFDEEERKQLYTLLLNHCTRRINRFNDKAALSEYLEINELLLENGLIFERGKLPPWRYTNIVHIALRLGYTDWTRRFIHRYKGSLPEAYAENALCYNLALYHYHLKAYDEAQRELLRLDFAEDVLLNTGARSLLIKLYYETGQNELLLSCLEATRLFLHRNQLLDSRMKSQMQKFIHYTTKLARLAPFEKDKLEKLAAALPPASEVMHRDWVAERIRERLGLKGIATV
jgi:hypothetical protein